MEILRKKGVKGIRIVEHNKKIMWSILILLAVLAVIIFSIKMLNNKSSMNYNNQSNAEECRVDSDCVPASCCHPKTCTSSSNAPKCDNMYCTMECAPGTLDCGQGSCKCSNNKCEASITKEIK